MPSFTRETRESVPGRGRGAADRGRTEYHGIHPSVPPNRSLHSMLRTDRRHVRGNNLPGPLSPLAHRIRRHQLIRGNLPWTPLPARTPHPATSARPTAPHPPCPTLIIPTRHGSSGPHENHLAHEVQSDSGTCCETHPCYPCSSPVLWSAAVHKFLIAHVICGTMEPLVRIVLLLLVSEAQIVVPHGSCPFLSCFRHPAELQGSWLRPSTM